LKVFSFSVVPTEEMQRKLRVPIVLMCGVSGCVVEFNTVAWNWNIRFLFLCEREKKNAMAREHSVTASNASKNIAVRGVQEQ